MIKVFNKQLFTLMCLLMTIGIFSACKKDNDEKNNGMVQLMSFGPTGAMPGDTLKFIGANLNLVTEIQLTGAMVAQPAFVSQSPELITIIVPASTEKGFVTLKTPQGDIKSKTQLDLEIPAKVTSMTMEARPGENITITGNFLNWVTRVTFANDKSVDSFVSKSLTQLVVKVPMDAQTGTLILNSAGTEPLVIETDSIFKVTLPMAAMMAPNPVKHQTNLTITGTNLDLTKSILFNGVSAAVTSFVSQSATQIVVKVPGGTTKGKIKLVAQSGVSTESATELDVVLPAVTSMSPNPIDALANLTIVGTNLDLVTSISFTGGLTAVTSFVSQTATQLVVKVPEGTLKGKITLAVLNSTLTVQSPEDLKINGGLPPLADLSLAIYTDGLQNTFQDWSYSDIHDFNSTANVRQGTKSVRAVYAAGGYQGVTFHAGTAPSTTGFTKLEFSVFGEAGTAGKKLNVVVNGNYGAPPQVTVLAGEWATFSITLSSLGNPATINEIVLQSAGWGGTVHIDHMGLR